MSSTEGNVAVLEADGNNRDNAEALTTTTAAPAGIMMSTPAHETTAENLPAPSSSTEPAPEPSTTSPNEAQVDNAGYSESSEERKETEELSASHNTAAPAGDSTAESTADGIPAATVIATPIQPTSASTDGPKTANITEEGESSDQTQPVKETTEETGPELVITLLLTTGARHPFKIDKKYLKRRSVKVDNDDPFNMSVYTLKELIWREWRSEWEPQPSSPSSIRLISFGKLLDDKAPLSESSLTHDAPNVIHMTVKPQEVVDEEDAKGGKSYSARDRETNDRSPGCRCVIL